MTNPAIHQFHLDRSPHSLLKYPIEEEEEEEEEEERLLPEPTCPLRHKEGKFRSRTIVLNIRGECFVTDVGTLKNIPGTRLARLAQDPNLEDQLDENGEIFFNKDPVMFGYIMDLYRNNELHIPKDKCVVSIQEDLAFWEIDEVLISLCCKKRYFQGLNMLYKTEFIKQQLASLAVKNKTKETNSVRKKKLTTFLKEANSSRSAKAWSYAFNVMLFLSIGVIYCSTHTIFRVQGHTVNTSNSDIRPTFFTLRNNQVAFILSTGVSTLIMVLELICCVFFTVDLVLVLASCTSCREVLNFSTFCSLVYLVPAWINVFTHFMDNVSKMDSRVASLKLSLHICSILRVLMLHRYIQMNRDMLLLWFALKSSFKELILMVVLVLSVGVMSASLMFATDLFDDSSIGSMMTGLWWAVVTITTVGYGDVNPRSWLGHLVACLCILSGVITTGMAIPLITKRFHIFYQTRLPADINIELMPKKRKILPRKCKILT